MTIPHTTPAAILPELLDLIRFQQEYIVAIPSDVAASLPAMPGFDGDWAVDLVERAKALAASAPVAPTPPDWRELCRRLYVELFHCDKQMTCSLNEDGKPIWRTGTEVRDVLSDAKAALEAYPITPEAAPVAPTRQMLAPEFDLSTSAGGRGYVAWYFEHCLLPHGRHDFRSYINGALAADFACALARHLSVVTEAAPVAPAPQPVVPEGFVLVPLEFVRGFNTLAHNYSLRAEPPDHYRGVEGDAFSSAYARCGQDLAELITKLKPAPEAAPVAPAPQSAPMPYPTDAQIEAVYEQTMGQHLRSQDAPAVRRFGRAMFLCAWNAAAPKADHIEDDLAMVPAPLQQGEYPETLYEGGRESVDDALAVVESFGPGVQGLNDTFARQVLLGQEVRRLRAAYEHACQGRSDFRNLYRAARGAAQAAPAEDDKWRSLALQFDGHRMQALWHLKLLLECGEDHAEAVRTFLAGPPLHGEIVLAQRIAAYAQPAPVAEDAEAAANWKWLAAYLVGPRTDLDDEIVASESVNALRKLVSAARAQAAQPEGCAT